MLPQNMIMKIFVIIHSTVGKECMKSRLYSLVFISSMHHKDVTDKKKNEYEKSMKHFLPVFWDVECTQSHVSESLEYMHEAYDVHTVTDLRTTSLSVSKLSNYSAKLSIDHFSKLSLILW